MAYQLSPGVLVTEQDLTTIVPAVATTPGGFVGEFSWGPANSITVVDTENNLVSIFDKPNAIASANVVSSFFTVANFLSYGNQMLTIRAVGSGSKNAGISVYGNTKTSNGEPLSTVLDRIDNELAYESEKIVANSNVFLSAKYPGSKGNSLKVVLIDAWSWQHIDTSYQNLFDSAPNTSSFVENLGGRNDELHVLVIDEDGEFSGAKNTILEKWPNLSKYAGAKRNDGTSIYYKNALNTNSKYVWWRNHPSYDILETFDSNILSWGSVSPTNITTGKFFANLNANVSVSFTGGLDVSPSEGQINSSYNLFLNADEIDVALLPMGHYGPTVVKHVIQNLAEVRQDCMVFLSPPLDKVLSTTSQPVNEIKDYRNNTLAALSSSYAVMDSGWKYQYDRYNDVYRWVPLNADIAGLVVRTDFNNDPWWSPAGLNRGQIKNVVRLAYNPQKADRDILYKNGINPVITQTGYGTILFGDKTLLIKPSAFDRINVRRLFIVLEKAISIASRYSLFEFNDGFTRSQFKNLVEPFLRDVQGRRGVTDFLVVCDGSNNTPEVIDRNEFVADIYIKPTRSINFIQLNFIATRTGISFAEVGA